jgi:ribosomal-protein-alanine N-acetyltransferase
MGRSRKPLIAGLVVRKATRSDLIAIVEIEKNSFEFPWPKDAFQKELGNRWSTTEVLLDAGGAIVAFQVYWIVADELHLLDIAVSPDHRRKGIARAMVEHLEAVCGEQGLNYLTLEVRIGNKAAVGLYKEGGFVTIHRRKRYYVDNLEDALVMAKVLGSPDAEDDKQG